MNRKVYDTLVTVFATVFVISSFFIIRHYIHVKEQIEVYDNLIEIVEKSEVTEAETISNSDDKTFIPEYAELFAKNNDMVGWIKIDDTKINYPVMQSVNEPNFYQEHNFDKNYSNYGCPYIQENCNVETPSDNLIIYGHNMKDGSMFAGLEKFKNKDFWQEHKTVTFDTLTDRYEYEIVSVFKTFVYSSSPESFKYYEFVDTENEWEFDAYIEKCKELSLYNTGVTAEYGDKLITLSTCEYSHTDGRLVVVAKRIIKQEKVG